MQFFLARRIQAFLNSVMQHNRRRLAPRQLEWPGAQQARQAQQLALEAQQQPATGPVAQQAEQPAAGTGRGGSATEPQSAQQVQEPQPEGSQAMDMAQQPVAGLGGGGMESDGTPAAAAAWAAEEVDGTAAGDSGGSTAGADAAVGLTRGPPSWPSFGSDSTRRNNAPSEVPSTAELLPDAEGGGAASLSGSGSEGGEEQGDGAEGRSPAAGGPGGSSSSRPESSPLRGAKRQRTGPVELAYEEEGEEQQQGPAVEGPGEAASGQAGQEVHGAGPTGQVRWDAGQDSLPACCLAAARTRAGADQTASSVVLS